MKFDSSAPVGVFDSGVGGLSVLQHIRDKLPNEDLVYFADSGHAPYGEKTEAAIIERSLAVTEFLLTRGIKALVVACNTATAAAITVLRQRYSDLIIIGIEPGLKPAAALSKSGIVGVLATQATLKSEKFQRLHQQLSSETGARFLPQACIGLVDEIEKTKADPTKIRRLLAIYISPLLDAGADTLVLGCTHYPFVAEFIHQVTEERAKPDSSMQVRLIDTGLPVALHLERKLQQANLRNTGSESPALSVFTTGKDTSLRYAFSQWLKIPASAVTISSHSNTVMC